MNKIEEVIRKIKQAKYKLSNTIKTFKIAMGSKNKPRRSCFE